MACRDCGCRAPEGAPAHAILAALAVDDLDAALRLGLLEAAPCAGCAPACRERLQAARDARLRALAARARHRARVARLARLQAEREAVRRAPASPGALPPAAAAALARALEKARQRRP
ncbi:hypothetical protein [Thermomonas flagellata]|uniref:hypothetical protein n=1 Tax=Thermomonas flagellata TaxID=2888524 RepID=UPI001F03899A|nr:hypothetical protein [Thermomonas flagellata]